MSHCEFSVPLQFAAQIVMRALTQVVGTHLERLVSAHQQPRHSFLLVFEQLHGTNPSLLPLQSGVPFTPHKHLRAPA